MAAGDDRDRDELELAPTESPALAARPLADKLARDVARARIANQLFASDRRVEVGRYHLLEVVGSGGMGVVWSAYDPELDRKVAIKLLKPELVAARDRIVREGQALAKLSHPNVVPVFDVGVVGDQVYLVMEWVRGETLRAWAGGERPVRELVAAYRAAGEGLAAAHAAGLIHRDFKPDNVMRGDDGRVRVLDFGLARDELADGGEVAGTPRYMAPEQREGRALTPAVDQYALGVSLRESLPEPPRWLADILARATAPQPADRFPSMDALVAALGRDPATVRKRRLAVAGAVVFAGAAFVIGTLRAGGEEAAPCSGVDAELATVWNARVRETLERHLRALGPFGVATATTLGDDLGRYATTWTEARRAACRASGAGELPAATYERDLRCLARARSSLAAATDALASTDRDRLPSTLLAVRGLPDPTRCRVDSELDTIAPPPAGLVTRVDAIAEDVARARVLALAIDPRAIDAAGRASEAARALGYLPLAGRAALVHGSALLLQQRRAEAVTVLDAAVQLAFEAGDPATAVEAIARQLYAIAIDNAPGALPATTAETLASTRFVESIARGLPASGAFARALLFNNRGTLQLARKDDRGARRWFEEAMRVRPPITGATIELANVPGNLALVESDSARRDRLNLQEANELAAVVGEDHPLTLDVRLQIAIFVAHRDRAAAQLADACTRYQRMHPHLVETISQCAYELGWLAEERGDAAAARAAFAAVTVGSEARLAKAWQQLVDGDTARTATEMTALATALAAEPHFWQHFRAADAWLVAALAERDRERARDHLDRALDVLSRLPNMSTLTHYQRRLARVQRLRAAYGGPNARAQARAAATWYRAAGGYDGAGAEAERLAQ